MSLLSMVQEAARRLSLPVPVAAWANTTPHVALLVTLADHEGRALRKRHQWQAITKEHTFTTLAAYDQGAASFPSDVDGTRILNETMFNRTRRRFVPGPLDATEWQEHLATLVTRVNPAFRIRGNRVLLAPIPPAGETVAYEYVSRNFCQSSGGTQQSAWAADTDTGLLDEAVMTLGLIWRFRQAKGLDYQLDAQEYERAVLEAVINDGGRARLRTDRVVMDRVPTSPMVPDTLVFNP